MKRMIDSELIEPLRTDIKFDGMGNVTVGNNLEVGGNVFTLNGKDWGIFPVRSGNADEMIDDGFILTSVAPYLQPATKELSVTGLWISGDIIRLATTPTTSFNVVDPITKFENGILTIGDGDYDNFLARFNGTVTKDDISALQPKLYRHVLSLSNNSFMYSGYIVYISTSNLKVASLEDLTTLLKPSKNYIYPLTGTCTGLDTRDAIQFGSKNLYIKSFDKISYENNTWYFKDNYGDTEALDSVLDTVTPL